MQEEIIRIIGDNKLDEIIIPIKGILSIYTYQGIVCVLTELDGLDWDFEDLDENKQIEIYNYIKNNNEKFL